MATVTTRIFGFLAISFDGAITITSASCGANRANLLTAEQQAIAGGRGVWADENFVFPWDH